AVFAAVAEKVGVPEFVGYDRWTDVEGKVLAIVRDDSEVPELGEGTEGEVVLSPTPFYAESGGQIADLGKLEWEAGEAEVLDTQKPTGELTVSRVRVRKGTLRWGTAVKASVPNDVRLDTTANHTATHLLHKALKDIFGETVQQAGSLVAPDRLRFDYTWNRPLTDAEAREIERIVNERIRENLEVTKKVMPIEEARRGGAVSMFGEKYGEQVRVVSAGTFSSEFCGGCHVNRTGDIGLFKIVSDRSLAAGVRRMEALTGRGALEHLQSLDATARELASQLNVPVAEAPALVRSIQEKQKQLEKELRQLRVQLATAGSGSGAQEEEPVEVDGIRLVTRHVRDVSGGELRNLADTLRQKVKSGVVLIGSEADGKATLLAAVTSDVQAKVSASALISKLAPLVGGKGGGKPDLAQAGGKDPAGIPNALAQAEAAIRELLAG
ncbi:MAG: DHHA1 domain-containing protein, partial [Acidobacteria bacterium]|nr:DHHA1 domain-containing protein [Acidobacteriota bacterium]